MHTEGIWGAAMIIGPTDLAFMTSIFFGWFLFLCSHILITHFGKKNMVLVPIVVSFLISCAVGVWYLVSMLHEFSIATLFVYSVLYSLIHLLGIASYILLIFGVAYSSVRIRIVLLFIHARAKGITFKHIREIVQLFPVEALISDRLTRFVIGGILVERKGKYFCAKSEQAFSLHGYIIRTLRSIYGI